MSKGTAQTAHVNCITSIVIWPGFESIARLNPAILQRDVLYYDQVPSSCLFDRYFLEYLLRPTRLHSFYALFSLYALFSFYYLCQLY